MPNDWRCGECQARTPKGRDPATPVRVNQDVPVPSHSVDRVGHGIPQEDHSPSSPSAHEMAVDQTAHNITAEFCEYELALSVKSDTEQLLAGFQKMQDAMANDMRSLRDDMRSLFTEMHQARLEMADFRVCLSGVSARVEVLERRLDAVEQERAAAPAAPEPHSPAIVHLQTVVGLLQQEVADRDQEALLSDLEIGHLPEERGESALQSVTVLAAKLGVELDQRDIVYAERVGVAQGAAAGSEQPRARRLVVRLARRDMRDSLLAAARVRRTLTTADAGRAPAGGEHARIFINERLTRANRVLFARARELARRHQWRYVWTKRGRVNMRQAEGTQAFQIRSQADLDRIFGAAPV